MFGQLPIKRLGAVGAVIGNTPILCGGNDKIPNNPYEPENDLDSCISFQTSQWSESHSMNEKRSFSAGVQINSTTFWILGGMNFDSTEFIIQGQTNGIPGPKLPNELSQMCAVKFSEEEIFVIGGNDEDADVDEVWIYNPLNGFARNQGPSLNMSRYAHSCGIMTDGERTFIVVAGGYSFNEFWGPLNSVEIYDPTDKTWHSGT